LKDIKNQLYRNKRRTTNHNVALIFEIVSITINNTTLYPNVRNGIIKHIYDEAGCSAV